MKTTALIIMAVLTAVMCARPLRAKEPAADEKAATVTAVGEKPALSEPAPAFQPMALDPELVRKNMQARAEYEGLNRKILARQAKLYEENPKIQELQVKMREIQGKIERILAQDEELIKLKDKLQSVSPAMPMGVKKPAPGALPLAPPTPPPGK